MAHQHQKVAGGTRGNSSSGFACLPNKQAWPASPFQAPWLLKPAYERTHTKKTRCQILVEVGTLVRPPLPISGDRAAKEVASRSPPRAPRSLPGSRAEGQRTHGAEPRGPYRRPARLSHLGFRTPASCCSCKRSHGPFNLRGIERTRPADMTSMGVLSRSLHLPLSRTRPSSYLGPEPFLAR